MDKVLTIIREDVASDKVRVDTPTQNLEGYFLDIVKRALRMRRRQGRLRAIRLRIISRAKLKRRQDKY